MHFRRQGFYADGKLLQQLRRYSEAPFELAFWVMDPGYNEINRKKIESNAEPLHIPITIFETNVFAVANSADTPPCYLCARIHRGHLYKKAKEVGHWNRRICGVLVLLDCFLT